MKQLRLVLLLVTLILVAVFGLAFLRGSAPVINADDFPKAIGGHKQLFFTIRDSSGISSVKAYYVQKGHTIQLGEQNTGSHNWFFTGNNPTNVHFMVQGGRLENNGLLDGQAELVVEARSANLRGSTSRVSREVTIRSTPPQLTVFTSQHNINQGGCDMVVYHVSNSATTSGVEMGGNFFPGFLLPKGEPGVMFSIYSFAWDAPPDSMPRVIARDDAGNEARVALTAKTFLKNFKRTDMKIDENYITNIIGAVIANTPSLTDQQDPVKNFLMVNRDLRNTDTRELEDISHQSAQEFLWHGAFVPPNNSAVEATFADHRSYIYNGKVVDEEDHLGFDLASVRHAPVLAANGARVVWARYFGIYGNAVLLDHGFGLMSLYAHLNDFAVKAGDTVRAGDLLGHSDSTGLATGDHLHFSVLLDGVQVNPREWWDPHWIHDHIEAKLQTGGPEASSSGGE